MVILFAAVLCMLIGFGLAVGCRIRAKGAGAAAFMALGWSGVLALAFYGLYASPSATAIVLCNGLALLFFSELFEGAALANSKRKSALHCAGAAFGGLGIAHAVPAAYIYAVGDDRLNAVTQGALYAAIAFGVAAALVLCFKLKWRWYAFFPAAACAFAYGAATAFSLGSAVASSALWAFGFGCLSLTACKLLRAGSCRKAPSDTNAAGYALFSYLSLLGGALLAVFLALPAFA